MRWSRAATLALTILLAHDVRAAVLTVENEPQLCSVSQQGRRVVDKDSLAHLIVTEAGAGLYLDGSNPTGLRDRSIQLKTSDGVLSEPVYAVLNAGTKAVPAENQPFGPNVDLRKDKRALQARDAISKVMRDELTFLLDKGAVTPNPTLTYRVERRMVVGAPTAEIEWKNPELLFNPDSPLVILCVAHEGTRSPAAPTAETPPKPSIGASLVDVVRLRGTVKDLTIKAEGLKSAKPASFTYQHDGKAKTSTSGFNGVLGVRFGDTAGVFDALPFLSYENRSVTGNKGDIEKFSPGLLLGYKVERSRFAVHARLETSLIQDIEFDARQGKVRLYVDPAFALGSGRGVLFGSYLAAIGPLQWRPDLTLIGDASHIYDRGRSAALAKASDYFGLGSELSLRTRLNLGQPISDFVLQLGLRHLQLFGDIRKNAAQNLFGSLDYAPENFPYLGIGLSFSKGENDDTFQNKEIYGLNLTIRY